MSRNGTTERGPAVWFAREAAEGPRGDLVTVDTTNVVELRARHPELFSDAAPWELADAYARQVDELARLAEDWHAASGRYARAVDAALGELHTALDELAARLALPSGGDAS